MFFTGGSSKKYDGPRDSSGIVNWLKKRTGPAAATVSSVQEVEALKEANEVVVVGIFSDLEGESAKAFMKAAAGFDDVVFAITSEGGVAVENSEEESKDVVEVLG